VVGAVAVAFAVLAAAALARGKPGDPKPIPGGFSVPPAFFFHVMPPFLPNEMSTIGDFDGTLGAADIQGTAHRSDGATYTFDADMRFMRGHYIGRDGRKRWGTFGFV